MTRLSLEDYIYAPAMASTIVVVGRQWSSCLIPRITPLLLRKGLLWQEWYQPMKFLNLWSDDTVGALQTQRWAKEGHAGLTVKERRKILFEKLELSGLRSWTEEDKEKALNLLAKYHDIFALEDVEMGCTKAAEHKIKVMDPKHFKERPRNTPSGLLEEMKDHLDPMLDVGVIKPSKSAWSNAVVLVCKRDGGLRFCINF